MKSWLVLTITGLSLTTLSMTVGCERNPQAKRIVRFQISKSALREARSKALNRRLSKTKTLNTESRTNQRNTVTTFADTAVGDQIIFCGGVAVTADDLAETESTGNQCNFTGVDPFNGADPGEDVSVEPNMFFGLIGSGETGTVIENPFEDPNISGDEFDVESNEDGSAIIVEIAVTPGEQRKFNIMGFDIHEPSFLADNPDRSSVTCEDFMDADGKLRLNTNSQTSGDGHIFEGFHFFEVTADVNDGVTEIIVEDGVDDDTELNECCGPLFNENCEDLTLVSTKGRK